MIALSAGVVLLVASADLRGPEASPMAPDMTVPSWALPKGTFVELLEPTEMRAVRSVGSPVVETVESGWTAYVYTVAQGVGGTVWYRLMYAWGRVHPVFGWALAEPGDPGLSRIEIPCPEGSVTLAQLGADLAPNLLKCFGNRRITLTDVVVRADGLLGPPLYVGTPEWLASDAVSYLAWSGSGLLPFYSSLADSEIDENVPAVVTGSFDHPAAADCSRHPVLPRFTSEASDESEFMCRARFVVEAFEPSPSP